MKKRLCLLSQNAVTVTTLVRITMDSVAGVVEEEIVVVVVVAVGLAGIAEPV